jgi:pimeloyl-ACP methyl ester carboxylesterase
MMYYSLIASLPVILASWAIAASWYLSDMIRKSALTPSVTYLWAADMVKMRAKLGAEAIEIPAPGPRGTLPVLYFAGKGTTWLIGMHGKGGNIYDHAYGIPYLAAKMGIHALSAGYRNDQGTFKERFCTYGRTEWKDLQAAVVYATEHGAKNIILAGNSYGGGIVASFLRHSVLAYKVSAVIFEAPMLDVRQCIRQVGRSLPYVGKVITPLVILAERIAAFRFKVDWDAATYLPDVSWLKVPALVFHGDKDTIVPVRTSVQLKKLLPDLVMLERDASLGHGGMAADKNHLPLTAAFLRNAVSTKEREVA